MLKSGSFKDSVLILKALAARAQMVLLSWLEYF